MLNEVVQEIDLTLRKFLLCLIKSYRYLLSPWIGNQCRFYPTCSAYALDALHYHNTIKGIGLIVWRLLRCHPLHPGGYDPVPVHCMQLNKKEIK